MPPCRLARLLVSIAKAIPSLLELQANSRRRAGIVVSIAKAIPSLLELPLVPSASFNQRTFQSRKRFRHCWSALTMAAIGHSCGVSIAKAIPSLLEPADAGRVVAIPEVSIAKAIPSLLELAGPCLAVCELQVSIAKAIPSLLEPIQTSP